MAPHPRLAFRSLGLASVVLLTTAAMADAREQSPSPPPLVFLTRDGCVNTATMRTRLDEALARLRLSTDYTVVDADTLPADDVRRGYGTPTVLYDDRDLFGMPAPTPPLPEPT